ncbi:MAG: UDP-2,3-diacylglucosamine diphosphatase [Gammaproteobacteria bacterium]|nr:UDP-2,3-diacylglucosamine diphosphatase [Gammaproteobacteria bacterium]MCW8987024.1 UDP-2,3-diacylglucosamine diphosphatase [Gammaproteobacteria bacterium]MCW9030428.1 UDP-2,3-diacylglucosamine diphosphatase [Gammaproteobacteria bacterium]
MSTLFISDLHLSGEREKITELFIDFLVQRASKADALYILGDLFEVWPGDDMIQPDYKDCIAAMKQLADSGVPLFVMQGNRDFLMAEQFAEVSGATLIEDPTIIDLYGTPTLLMHGDTLCSDDIEYQKFRTMVRDPCWKADFLSKPSEERLAMTTKYRKISKEETAKKTMDIMDVNQHAVEEAMLKENIQQLIHGHTHRPAIHNFTANNKKMKRIVLGDWFEQGSVLACDKAGCHLESV